MKEKKSNLHYVLDNKPAVDCNEDYNAEVEQACVALEIFHLENMSKTTVTSTRYNEMEIECNRRFHGR